MAQEMVRYITFGMNFSKYIYEGFYPQNTTEIQISEGENKMISSKLLL